MRLTTTVWCQLNGTFAGFLPTVRYLPAVALVSYLFDRSHSWYAAFLKIFVLVQGTYTPQVIRHDRRTKRKPLLTNDVWKKILSAALTKACLEEQFRLIAFVFMPEHVHLLVLPENPQSKVSRLLGRTKQPASKQIRALLEANDSDLVRQLTVQERPGNFCIRFWQEGPGFDRNFSSAEAVSSSIDDIHTNPVKRGLCRAAVDDKWSSARFHLQSIIDADLPMLQRPAPEWFHNSGAVFEVS